jgi:hypothetical protein
MPYSKMIKLAFKHKYVQTPKMIDPVTLESVVVPVEGDLTVMEANFSLYWGLAIQLYEATLVSNMTPFDQFARGDNLALNPTQKLGLELFIREDRGNCVSCHVGSEFTGASVRARAFAPDGGDVFNPELGVFEPAEPLERMATASGEVAVYDGGFYNIGVTHSMMDKGIGSDLGGFPLSYARQASSQARVDAEADEEAIGTDDDFAITSGPVKPNERLAVDGAFKTPTLRNVELTAPYFHNGSHATLIQVIVAYKEKFNHLYADENKANMAPAIPIVDIEGLAFDGTSIRGGEIDALEAFMKALTDERVLMHQAPFDHPELFIPNGSGEGESGGVDANKDGVADDSIIYLPAVGAGGLSDPLPMFLKGVASPEPPSDPKPPKPPKPPKGGK